MDTTVQISKELLEKLKMMKIHSKESYENIIWDLIEDRMELSEETIVHIKEAENDFKEGRFKTITEVKKDLGLNV